MQVNCINFINRMCGAIPAFDFRKTRYKAGEIDIQAQERRPACFMRELVVRSSKTITVRGELVSVGVCN